MLGGSSFSNIMIHLLDFYCSQLSPARSQNYTGKITKCQARQAKLVRVACACRPGPGARALPRLPWTARLSWGLGGASSLPRKPALLTALLVFFPKKSEVPTTQTTSNASIVLMPISSIEVCGLPFFLTFNIQIQSIDGKHSMESTHSSTSPLVTPWHMTSHWPSDFRAVTVNWLIASTDSINYNAY